MLPHVDLRQFIGLEPAERVRRRKEFQDLLFSAVADGKLTEAEMEDIEAARDSGGLIEEDLEPVRLQLYTAAFHAVAADRDVTEDEWHEMQKIQGFLGIADPEVERSKRELLRLHILRELRDDKLPVLPAPSGLAVSRGELVRWRQKGRTGDELVVTDRRLVVRGPHAAVVRVSRITDVASGEGSVVITDAAGECTRFSPEDSADVRLLRALIDKVVEAHNA